MVEFLNKQGIQLDPAAPHTPERQGRASQPCGNGADPCNRLRLRAALLSRGVPHGDVHPQPITHPVRKGQNQRALVRTTARPKQPPRLGEHGLRFEVTQAAAQLGPTAGGGLPLGDAPQTAAGCSFFRGCPTAGVGLLLCYWGMPNHRRRATRFSFLAGRSLCAVMQPSVCKIMRGGGTAGRLLFGVTAGSGVSPLVVNVPASTGGGADDGDGGGNDDGDGAVADVDGDTAMADRCGGGAVRREFQRKRWRRRRRVGARRHSRRCGALRACRLHVGATAGATRVSAPSWPARCWRDSWRR